MSEASRNDAIAARAAELVLANETVVRVLVDAFAQAQHDVISEETNRRIAAHRAAGTWTNPARVLISDEAVARILELRAEGLSQGRIACQLEEEGFRAPRGGRSWSQQTIRKTLLRVGREQAQ